jgi:uncharacterized membrane protein
MAKPRKLLLLAAACLPALSMAGKHLYKAVPMTGNGLDVEYSHGVGRHGAVALRIYNEGADEDYAGIFIHGQIEQLPDSLGSEAFDVNAAGDAVGYSSAQAVIWPRTGGKFVIPTPKPQHASEALAINDAGMVVGMFAMPGNADRCFAWTPENGYVDFGMPPGGDYCQPVDVNDHGQATGNAIVDGAGVAFIWKKGQFELLPLLAGTDRCYGTSINDFGDVAGSCIEDPSNKSHPVLWRQGAIIDLYPHADLQDGEAVGIDDAGTIVGAVYSQTLQGQVVFDGQGGATDLRSLVRDGQDLNLGAIGGINKDGTMSVGRYKLVPLRR